MQTIEWNPLWTLRRAGALADVSCETALLLDASDVPHHGVLVKLNGQPVYDVLFARREDAERAAADAFRDLKTRGWRDDLDWMRATAAPGHRAA